MKRRDEIFAGYFRVWDAISVLNWHDPVPRFDTRQPPAAGMVPEIGFCSAGTCAAFAIPMQSVVPSVSAAHAPAAADRPMTVSGFSHPSRRWIAIAVSAFLFAIASAPADDRILTLAMVNYSLLPAHQVQTMRDNYPGLVPTVFKAPDEPAATSAVLTFFSAQISISPARFAEMQAQIERPFQLEPPNVLALAGQASSDRGFARVWNRLGAGYGQVFYDKTAVLYGRNGTRWEEPGCGYLKISFRF